MQARDAAEQAALELGGAVVRLRARGYSWLQIGRALDLLPELVKRAAVRYPLRSAETRDVPGGGGIVQAIATSAPRPPHFKQ